MTDAAYADDFVLLIEYLQYSPEQASRDIGFYVKANRVHVF